MIKSDAVVLLMMPHCQSATPTLQLCKVDCRQLVIFIDHMRQCAGFHHFHYYKYGPAKLLKHSKSIKIGNKMKNSIIYKAVCVTKDTTTTPWTPRIWCGRICGAAIKYVGEIRECIGQLLLDLNVHLRTAEMRIYLFWCCGVQ